MKDIFFVVPSMLGGGAERTVQLLLEGLDRKRFRPRLIIFDDIVEYEIPSDVELVCLNKRGRYDFLRLVRALAGILRRERPHVVVSFLTYANIVTALARTFSRWSGRLVLSEHNNFTATLREEKLELVKRWLVKRLYPQSYGIICVSDGVKNDLERNFSLPPEKLKTVYNSVDVLKIAALSGEKPAHPWYLKRDVPVIVSVGRLSWQKAYPDLLKAFAVVRSSIDCRLVMVGKGEEHESLERLANELGVGGDVTMVGFQENPFSYMAHSDVFVLSSHYEGFANVIMEAMACGVPVISTDCPNGPNEIIEDGKSGLLVPVRDRDAMAGAILRLLEDGSLRRRLAETGMRRVEEFGVERMVTEYEKIFS